MKAARILSIAFGLLLLVAGVSKAQEREFKEFNFAITPPSGWEEIHNFPPQKAKVAAVYRAPDKERLLLLLIEESGNHGLPIDEKYAEDFEQGFAKQGGGKRLSSRFFDVAGVRAYERTGDSVVKGRKISNLTQVIIAGRRTYMFEGLVFNGDIKDDTEIAKCLATFRFINPPAKPLFGAVTDSESYRAGYRVGRILGFVMIPAAILAVIITVILLAVRRPSGKPPPVPPRE